ncbi:uncharacterized protein LOC129590726 [Paramacrobiotus metropolitanus]|uniref:uncharacterized protein LOC129590726 n=1 Tax=Paramacrobiotus metropolitanus TaxID=2943436 RepID=UPI002445A523|nr:uncharacterized protein LOC129590726 [Paramacrobiotus metropolitanus]
MRTTSLNILLITAICLIGDSVSGATVKPLSDNRFRTVELVRDEALTLECPSDRQPFIEFGTVQLMEAYTYDKTQQICRIQPAFCQPGIGLWPPPPPIINDDS